MFLLFQNLFVNAIEKRKIVFMMYFNTLQKVVAFWIETAIIYLSLNDGRSKRGVYGTCIPDHCGILRTTNNVW